MWKKVEFGESGYVAYDCKCTDAELCEGCQIVNDLQVTAMLKRQRIK